MSARRTLVLTALAASLAASAGCGGDEPAAPAGAARAAGTASPTAAAEAAHATDSATPAGTAPSSPALLPEQVALIDGELPLTWADLDRYLGTVYARMPEGEDALTQLVTEAVIDAAATQAGVVVSDADIATLEARLEAQAREASGGTLGLQESLGESVTLADLRVALRLQALHEAIVRHELGLAADAPVDPAQLRAWVDAHMPGDALEHPPLQDALAARWSGGEVTKAQVGRRLRSLLAADAVSGVLTEMLGVLLVRREAARLGLSLTPAEATKEILDRNEALRAKAGSGDVSYDQFVQTVQKRSLKEVLESDQFGAEVLLRLISERQWNEDSARGEWQAHPERFQPLATATPEPRDWEHLRPVVWRALRQDCYARLFQQSRIVRRI